MTYQFSCTCGAWLETDSLGYVYCKRCEKLCVIVDHTIKPVKTYAKVQLTHDLR